MAVQVITSWDGILHAPTCYVNVNQATPPQRPQTPNHFVCTCLHMNTSALFKRNHAGTCIRIFRNWWNICEIYHLLKWNPQNYSNIRQTNMCSSDEGSTMVELCYFYIVHSFLAANFIVLAWVLFMHTMGLQCSKLWPWGTRTEWLKNLNAISRVGYCLKKWNRFWCIWKKVFTIGLLSDHPNLDLMC
jgi:hypothetical protein